MFYNLVYTYSGQYYVLWFCLFICFFIFKVVFFFVVAEIFTILVMLMPNVTKINLFRPRSCKIFYVAEHTPCRAPHWHHWGRSKEEDGYPFIGELAGLGLLSVSSQICITLLHSDSHLQRLFDNHPWYSEFYLLSSAFALMFIQKSGFPFMTVITLIIYLSANHQTVV